jgi:hypothetical protein
MPANVRLEVPLGEQAHADLALVDELARLTLAAKRSGCEITLIDVPDDLLALIGLVGLARALGLEA